MSDHFSDFDEQTTSAEYSPVTQTSKMEDRGQGGYSNEVFSEKISAKHRTFFIDVKENTHGHLIKVSEKSRGRKSTIMMDAEDLEEMITALTNAKNYIENDA